MGAASANDRTTLPKKNFKQNLSTKPTWPRRSSARTQPADHISIEDVYSVAPNISSGAR